MSVPTSGEYNIVIDMPEETGQNDVPDPSAPQQENAPPTDPARGNGAQSAVMAGVVQVVTSAGKQALSSAVSNIGLATGNEQLQKSVQNAISVGTTVASVAGMVATQNYVAAIITAVSATISTVTEVWQYEKQREIANVEAGQYARKLGYTNARR